MHGINMLEQNYNSGTELHIQNYLVKYYVNRWLYCIYLTGYQEQKKGQFRNLKLAM